MTNPRDLERSTADDLARESGDRQVRLDLARKAVVEAARELRDARAKAFRECHGEDCYLWSLVAGCNQRLDALVVDLDRIEAELGLALSGGEKGGGDVRTTE